MVSTATRDVQDQDEMWRVVHDLVTQGYRIKEQGPDATLLKKKAWGSAARIFILIIVTFAIGLSSGGVGILYSWLIPVGYVLYAHHNAPEVLVRTV